MPTKRNRAGNQQNYVEAGHGDASGEYGDNATGSNKHFQSFKKPRETKSVKFKFNKYYKTWNAMTDSEWEAYQRQKENAEKYGYYGYKDDEIKEEQLSIPSETETNQIKEDFVKKLEEDINNATIDTIQDYVELYSHSPQYQKSLNGVLDKYNLNDNEKEYFERANRTTFNEYVESKVKKKAEEKALELSQKYINENFTKIDGEHTIDEDLKNVNPNYDKKYSYRINCQRCSFAYELRRRGYNVEANPNENEYGRAYRWKEQMIFKEEKSFKNRLGARGVASKIIDEVKKSGDGSRWAVEVQWYRSSSGHLFIAENVGGEVKFFDAQTGKNDVINYFNNIASTKTTEIYRMDNADFYYGVKETGFSPNKKGE